MARAQMNLRVKDGSAALIDEFLDGSLVSRSAWVRALVGWGLANGWMPGQVWRKDGR